MTVGSSSVAAWATCGLLVGGGYWYLEDNRRDLMAIREDVHASFEGEKERDDNWLDHENRKFATLERGQERLMDAIQHDKQILYLWIGKHEAWHKDNGN